jgi:hypothetical protein
MTIVEFLLEIENHLNISFVASLTNENEKVNYSQLNYFSISNNSEEIEYYLNEIDDWKNFRNYDFHFEILNSCTSNLDYSIYDVICTVQDSNYNQLEQSCFVLTIYGYDFSMIDEYSEFKILFIIED